MPKYRNREQTIFSGDFALYQDQKRELPYLMPVKIQQINYFSDEKIEIRFHSLQISYVEDWHEDLAFYYFESDADHLKNFYREYLEDLKNQADQQDIHACFAYASLSQFWSYHGALDAVDAMQQAVQYFAQASEAGHAQASHTLAEMYRKIVNPLYQSCFEPNREQLFQNYLEKSAEQGYALGQYQLGYFYEYGSYGFIPDIEKAVYWYQQSAEQDYPQALNNLGDKYEKAKGVKRDYQKAVFYYQRSADHQIPEAMYNLGRLYLRGLGVEKDLHKAKEWLERAAAKYDKSAIRKLKELDKKSIL